MTLKLTSGVSYLPGPAGGGAVRTEGTSDGSQAEPRDEFVGEAQAVAGAFVQEAGAGGPH